MPGTSSPTAALWDEVLGRLDGGRWDGRALFAAPHRDRLFYGPLSQDSIDQLGALLDAADWHDTHALAPVLLLRQGGQWQALERGGAG